MSEKQSNKKRPRVTNFQKTSLVSLVQNFFIRSVGHHSSVNFDEINGANWERIASILNPMGPAKTGAQWKSTLYYMRNRIRKTVKQILGSGASPHDILSALDLKIYEMISTDDFGVMGTSDDNANEGELNSDIQPEQDSQDGLDDGTGNLDEFHSKSLEEEDEGNYYDTRTSYDDYPELQAAMKNEIEPEIGDVLEIDPASEEESSTDAAVVHSNRTLVVESVDELDAHFDSTIIEEDAYEENSTHSEHIFPVGASTASFTERPPSVGRSPSASSTHLTHRTQSIDRPASNDRPPSVDQAPFIARRPSVDSSPFVKNKIIPKTNVRIPEIQKERLVQLVQNNFLKAMGRFAGSNGKGIKAQLWQSIAKELNTLGPHRSAEQWKTTFNAIKASAKAKLADAHNGSGFEKPLTRLEEKIVSIYGMNSLDGQQTLGESGFHYKKTIPATATRQVTPAASCVEIEADVQTTTTTDEIERSVLEDILREIRDESNVDTDEIAPLNELDIAILTSNVNRSNASVPLLQPGLSQESSATLQSGSVAARPSNPVASRPSNLVAERQSGPGTTRSSGLATSTTRPSHLGTAHHSGHVAERQINAGSQSGAGSSSGRQYGSGSGRHAAAGGNPVNSHTGRPNSARGAGSQSGTGSGSGRHAAAGGNLANSHTGQSNSARRRFAPPLRARRNRRESECEYITNINQFFNDDTDEEEGNQRSTPSENRGSGTTPRDRSNLRNNQTSFQMVQRSISSQERFIEDANRNHSEMMYLIDRNHVETVGMYNSLLSGIFDLGREYLDRH